MQMYVACSKYVTVVGNYHIWTRKQKQKHSQQKNYIPWEEKKKYGNGSNLTAVMVTSKQTELSTVNTPSIA